jgi:Fe-S-cluster containining protein
MKLTNDRQDTPLDSNMSADAGTDPLASVDLSRFVCHQCGNCCRGDGIVSVDDDYLSKIAQFLGLDLESFAEACLLPRPVVERSSRQMGLNPIQMARLLGKSPLELYRQKTGDFHLRSKNNPTLDCIFLTEAGCQIHTVKPRQCVAFPTAWRNPDSVETCAGLRALVEQTCQSPKTH